MICVRNVSGTFVEHFQEQGRDITGGVKLDTQDSFRMPSANCSQVSDLHQDLGPMHRLRRALLCDVTLVGTQDGVLYSFYRFGLLQSCTI